MLVGQDYGERRSLGGRRAPHRTSGATLRDVNKAKLAPVHRKRAILGKNEEACLGGKIGGTSPHGVVLLLVYPLQRLALTRSSLRTLYKLPQSVRILSGTGVGASARHFRPRIPMRAPALELYPPVSGLSPSSLTIPLR